MWRTEDFECHPQQYQLGVEPDKYVPRLQEARTPHSRSGHKAYVLGDGADCAQENSKPALLSGPETSSGLEETVIASAFGPSQLPRSELKAMRKPMAATRLVGLGQASWE
jgi:hypothetical protein